MDDRRAVIIGCVVAGFVFAQQAAVRVVRDTLFLSVFPATLLPVAMIAASVGAMLSVVVVSRGLARFSPSALLPWVTVTASVCFLVEWALTAIAPRTAAALLYVHFSVFGGVVVSGFWSCVNERFDPLAARDAMRRIGLAGSCGALLGGAAVWAAVRVVSVPTLLPVLGGISLLVSFGMQLFAAGEAPRRSGYVESGAPAESAVAILRRVSYLRVLALVVACGAMTDTFLDYVFKSQAAAQIRNPAELASFLGLLNTAIAFVALAIQTGLSARCLAKLGLAGTVAVRPAGVLVASVAGFVHPGLWTALGARAFHDAVTRSLFRSGYEPLFTPLPEREKRPTKAVVDVAIDKLGSLLGSAVVLAVLALVPAQSVGVLLGATLALSAVAMALTPRLQRGYVTTLERNLRAGVIHLEKEDVVDEATRSTIVRASLGLEGVALGVPDGPVAHADPLLEAVVHLRSGEPQRIVRVLTKGELPSPLVAHVIALLERDDLVPHVVRALRSARPTPVGQLVDTLLDTTANPVVRARVPRVLRGLPCPRTVEGLLMGLGDDRADVRVQCARALAVLERRGTAVVLERERIFAAIEGELARRGDDPDVEHVFTLLSLTLDREPLRLALRALRGGERGERGTALEYLTNVLPARVREPLWPHLLDPDKLRGSSPSLGLTSSPAVAIDRLALRAHLDGGDSSHDVIRERTPR